MSGIDLSSWFTPSTSLLLQTAAGTIGAMGAYNQAESQAASIGYEASIAGVNAEVATYQRTAAMQIGQQNLDSQNMKTAQMMGAETATMAANGVVLSGGGTPADVLAGTRLVGDVDATTIQNNTARMAWADQVQAIGDTAQQSADQSIEGAISPVGAALSSLLGTATAVAPGWYKYAQSSQGTTKGSAQ